MLVGMRKVVRVIMYTSNLKGELEKNRGKEGRKGEKRVQIVIYTKRM